MVREAFRRWLDGQPYKAGTKSTQWSQANRIEKQYGDLDEAYDDDRFAAIRADLQYSQDDKRGDRPNPSRFEIDGDVYSNLAGYRATLTYYSNFRASEAGSSGAAAQPALDRAALERLKADFLKRYPDFASLGFAASNGSYWEEERAYKDTVIGRTTDLLADDDRSDREVGEGLLALLQQPPANFVGWRTFAQIKDAGPSAVADIALALGQMLRDPDEVTTIAASCASAIHPLITGGSLGNPAYGQVRSLITTSLALARPNEAVAVKTRIMQRAAKQLLGRRIFKQGVMTAAEYRQVLDLADAIFAIMRDVWGWQPKDLWDVQGFLWVTSELYTGDSTVELDEEEQVQPTMPKPESEPTNLILYGPPGTGKTFATAARAVELCDGVPAPSDRNAVKARYAQLVAEQRISFVTFHQSYAYEDFVEGLRPVSTAAVEGGSGFSLEPVAGIFKRIARRAEAGAAAGATPYSIGTRRVFKMSIGEAANPEDDYLFEEAMSTGYLLLGWGDKVDWSATQFSDRVRMIDAWRPHHPKDAPLTALSGHIKYPFMLRNIVKEGDLIVVSKGNGLFRAIGEVTGPYQFAPREQDEYANRRAVKWLWSDRRGVPVEEIYARKFSMGSLYELQSQDLNKAALERFIGSSDDGRSNGPAMPFVLIIDEINRANVSKVFGELITLIEPDKRLGGDNPLTVTLPYSQESFGVPSNLHIIGTMNTADRSIALLDTALRRRFEFEELMPKSETLAGLKVETGVDLAAVLDGINARIEYLFDRDHQIGHAFFMGCSDLAAVNRIMRTKVIPLLAEYFYENWEKVRLVLGETANQGSFIDRVELKAPKSGDAYQTDEGRWRYVVRSDYSITAYDQLKA